MKDRIKNYIQRHHEQSKLIERIYWWILRGLMFVAIGISLYRYIVTKDSEYITQVLQSSANLVGMFAWEIMLLVSPKSFLHYIPSYVQNITLLGFFLGSFGGAFMNLYYIFPPYDIILHVFGGAEATFIGYEIITAIQKRDKQTAPFIAIIFGAIGISLLFATGWEIFEFSYDQIKTILTPDAPGDSQHWSYALAQATDEIWHCGMPNVIPELDPQRYALIDTMEDTLANVLGLTVMSIILRFKPYHHMGPNNVNEQIEKDLRKEKRTEKKLAYKK